MGRPSQEYVDNSIKRLEEDRQKGVTTQVMERAMPIAADVWNIGFEAMPEKMYSGITGVIPESVPYIGGGGERAIETRRILDERSKQGKQIVDEFGATSPENLRFVYDTEKILEKRFEERPWWQEIGTSLFNPLDWLLGAGIGKGLGTGIRGVKALRGAEQGSGFAKAAKEVVDFDAAKKARDASVLPYRIKRPKTDLRQTVTPDVTTIAQTRPWMIDESAFTKLLDDVDNAPNPSKAIGELADVLQGVSKPGDVGSSLRNVKGILKGIKSVRGPRWLKHIPILAKAAAPDSKPGLTWAEGLEEFTDVRNVYGGLITPIMKALKGLKAPLQTQKELVEEGRKVQHARLAEGYKDFENVATEGDLDSLAARALYGGFQSVRMDKPLKDVLDNPEEVLQLMNRVIIAAREGLLSRPSNTGQFNLLDDLAKQMARGDDINPFRLDVGESFDKSRQIIQAGKLKVPDTGLAGFFDLNDAAQAFYKMYHLGEIPTQRGINSLVKLIGGDVGKELLSKRANTLGNMFARYIGNKIPALRMLAPVTRALGLRGLGASTPGELFYNLISLPKSLRASFDLSFPFRQGMVLAPQYPKQWMRSFNMMVRIALPGGEEAALALDRAIKSQELYEVFTRYGLDLSDVTGMLSVTAREDEFWSSMAGVIPYVRPSERAYVSMANKLRFDVMYDMFIRYENVMRNTGIDMVDFRKTDEYGKSLRWMARFVNDATGRGALPKTDEYSSALVKSSLAIVNAFLWSPRFLTSRIRLPWSAAMASRAMGNSWARAAVSGVAQGMVGWVGTGITVMLFFKYFVKDADASIDGNASDFGNVRVGNTRFDIWAGYAPLARAVAQLVSGEKTTSTGKDIDVSPHEILGKFAVSKFSPAGQMGKRYVWPAVTGTEGTGFFGEDADIWADMNKPVYKQSSLWYQLVVPMLIESIHDAHDEYVTPMVPPEMAEKLGIDPSEPSEGWERWLRVAAAGAAEGVGIGTSTYKTRDDIALELTQDWEQPQRLSDLPQMGKEPGVITQQKVKQVGRELETARGMERTTGLTGELAELTANEQESINNMGTIGLTIGGQTMSVDDWIADSAREDIDVLPAVRSKIGDLFFSIRSDFFSRKDQAMYGEEWKDVTQKELSQMDFKNRKLAEWRKIRSGARGPDEYNKMLDSFEDSLKKSAHPEAPMALAWIRMNAYDIDIPENILPHLPYTTQIKYDMARKLRRSGSPFVEGFGVQERKIPEGIREKRETQEREERQKKPFLQELYKG